MRATPLSRDTVAPVQSSDHATLECRSEEICDGSARTRKLASAATVHSACEISPSLELARIVPANAGDHPLIHELLLAVHQAPSRDEFQASLDDPYYEPSDRLLAKLADRMISHVHIAKRVMQFGRLRLPVAGMQWLATLPEYRLADFAEELLAAADRQMLGNGTVLAYLRTKHPAAYEHAGWVVLGQQSYTCATARDILAHLSTRARQKRKNRPIRTRMWRHVELQDLMNIYEQQTAHGYGPIQRTEAYWQWLISRKAYDQIIVAIEGEDTFDYGELGASIVGYAVIWQDRIVELMTLPSHRRASAILLARACREAIEQDFPTVFLHAPLKDRLHNLLLAAGGSRHPDSGAIRGPLMVKLLDPHELVRQLHGEFQARAKAAGLSCTCELPIRIGGTLYRFVLTRKSARLVDGRTLRAAMTCTDQQFAQLLLGGLDVKAACSTRHLRVTSKSARRVLCVLFPPLPVWHPPLDDLPA